MSQPFEAIPEQNAGAAFVASGAIAGGAVSSVVGGMGLAGGFGAVSVGTFPFIGGGAIAGAAVYGAVQAISEGDATAIGAIGLGAMGGVGVSSAVGGMGLAGSFGAVGIGAGTMATVGGLFGLGIYGLAKILDQTGSKEPAAQVFARMEEKILWQEAYTQALLELTLQEDDLLTRLLQLDVEADLQQLKAEMDRQKQFQTEHLKAAYRQLAKQYHPDLNPDHPQQAQAKFIQLTERYHALLETTAPAAPVGVWRCVHTLHHHHRAVNAIAFHPDGQTVVTGSDDNTVCLWDLHSGKRMFTFLGATRPVLAVAISPDAKTLAGGSVDQTITCWNPETRQYLHTLLPVGATASHNGIVYAIAFSADHKLLISGSADHTIRLWHNDQRPMENKLKRTLTGHTDTVFSIALSPDGKQLVSGSADRTIRIWDLTSWQPPRILTGHDGWVNAVALSPDGRWIASGSADGTLKLWDFATGQVLHTLAAPGAAIRQVVFSPVGQLLASSSNDHTITFWRFHTHPSLQVERLQTLPAAGAIAFSPDGNSFVNGTPQGVIQVWSQLAV